ncbi:uncharacterized protein LOC132301142 [Cornus florida]|uniref:uncharacterized protein LOC132301142 n=1 Tax=Cornus florida TaxID=4283 RepID=UPI002898D536|nr:uncharacterized protein LOC132301142 [Cornus florida]
MGELMEAVRPYHDITFISDRQKGLVETFDSLMERSDHRFCVRHLYENFKLRFKGQQLKIELWEAAMAYTEAQFQQHMRKIRDLNVEAYDWLTKVPAKSWARSSFTETSKNDVLINNICESWNAALNKVKQQTTMCKVHYAGENKYGVQCYGISEAVDIDKRSCSCKVWNLTGIPCRHAVACIFIKRDSPEVCVYPFYQRETYMKCYSGMILPIPMERLMKTNTIDPLLPPHYRKPICTPKKARKKKNDDPKGSTKLSRRSMVGLKCTRCKENGHNSRTCKLPEPLVIDRPPPRRGGRPPTVGRGGARGPTGMPLRGRGRKAGRRRERRVEVPAPTPSNQEVQNIPYSQL